MRNPDSKLIYIASPYSNPKTEIRESRYLAVMRYVVWSMQDDPSMIPFSPIVYCHEMAKLHLLPTDAAFWKNFNETIINQAREVHFLRLPGYRESLGFNMELKYMEDAGRKDDMFFVDEDSFTSYVRNPL